MTKENIHKYIGFVLILIVLVLVVVKARHANAPTTNEMPDKVVDTTTPDKTDTQTPTKTPEIKTDEEQALATKLQKTVDARDFEAFANVLAEVYKNQWGGKKLFSSIESSFYVYATDTYWVKGDLENSLRVSTVVYNKVPEAWRFRYLRIVTLEKYGRNAFNSGDLKTAEEYANKILQMMFRPEGANLMADIYIAKIKINIAMNDLTSAKNNLKFIWDYEVSADRRAILEGYKTQLGL